MRVEALWVRRIGDKIQVLFESSGRWYLAIEEGIDGAFSHIAEEPALEAAPLDFTAGPYYKNGQAYVTAKPDD